jgi:Mn2+/Fe2+ NRAMP family transporter
MLCAFTTMFSTTLTVTSTYPDIVNHLIHIHKHGPSSAKPPSEKRQKFLLIGISTGSLILLWLLGDRFRFLIDLATTLSFLTAPVLAFMNHKLIHQPEIESEFRPGKWLYTLSVSGIVFLTIFALIYLYWMMIY